MPASTMYTLMTPISVHTPITPMAMTIGHNAIDAAFRVRPSGLPKDTYMLYWNDDRDDTAMSVISTAFAILRTGPKLVRESMAGNIRYTPNSMPPFTNALRISTL